MLEYRGEVRTRNNSKDNISGVNLDPVPEMKLNDESIYDFEGCAGHTEVNKPPNLYTFTISMNY